MDSLYLYKGFQIHKLTKDLTEKYIRQICTALDQIPLVEKHTTEQLLSDTKDDRILYDKWEHSLIALTPKINFAGVIIGYERKSEKNDQYPHNSIYLNDFAVASDHQKQGLGKYLLKSWLQYNTDVGFLELEGHLRFSVQTNSAPWNIHVQNLYESFGFHKTGTKKYANRIDTVYLLEGKHTK